MKRYCVIQNSTVVNIIMADSIEVAQQISKKECIESDDPQIIVGSVLVDNVLKPYASWILSEEGHWVAPVASPTGLKELRKYEQWNEETQQFDIFDFPTEVEGLTPPEGE